MQSKCGVKHIEDVMDMVKEFNISQYGVVLCGSALMSQFGLRDNKDVDILLSEEDWNRVSSSIGINSASKVIRYRKVEAFKEIVPLFLNSSNIPTIRLANWAFQSLDSMIDWKIAMGREKDIADIDMIFSDHTVRRVMSMYIDLGDDFDEKVISGLAHYYRRMEGKRISGLRRVSRSGDEMIHVTFCGDAAAKDIRYSDAVCNIQEMLENIKPYKRC